MAWSCFRVSFSPWPVIYHHLSWKRFACAVPRASLWIHPVVHLIEVRQQFTIASMAKPGRGGAYQRLATMEHTTAVGHRPLLTRVSIRCSCCGIAPLPRGWTLHHMLPLCSLPWSMHVQGHFFHGVITLPWGCHCNAQTGGQIPVVRCTHSTHLFSYARAVGVQFEETGSPFVRDAPMCTARAP